MIHIRYKKNNKILEILIYQQTFLCDWQSIWRIWIVTNSMIFTKLQESPMPVAHTCNPSYSGGRDQKDQGSKPASSCWKKPITKKGWWIVSRWRPWVQTPVRKKKKKKYERWALVAHTYNPNYSGGRNQEDSGFEASQVNSSQDLI
jgi:hypothetical protein